MRPGRDCVTHISPDGQTKCVIAQTERPNGLAVDKDGVVWVADLQTPSLLRMTMDGEIEVFLTECDGEPFLFPNDLAFGPDGAPYMTDTGILFAELASRGPVHPDYSEIPIDGRVFKIDVNTKAIVKLDSGIRFTNGIAFDAQNNLYVNGTITAMVFR